MSPAPLQPIPEATQPYVDRLIGAQVGEHRVQQHVCEGRFGTIYRCRHLATGEEATLEVLRTLLVGDTREVGAANAIRSPGVAAVRASGELPDGRRYRMMEPLEGESLEAVLQRGARLAPQEAASVLALVANVLMTTHAWAVAHGCLGPSSVFLAGGAVKLIDFGLTRKPATPADDLRALGALGFALLTGQELEERAPPPATGAVPEPLHRLLRELMAGQVASARAALERLEPLRATLAAGAPARSALVRRLAWLVALGAGIGLLATAAVLRPGAPPAESEPSVLDEAAWEDDVASADEPADEQLAEPADQAPRPQPTTRSLKPPRKVPSARALNEEISRLEMRLRREVRPGDDFDQGMFVLNKQRLRLTGAPTPEDRAEVARQLRAWRSNYLKR